MQSRMTLMTFLVTILAVLSSLSWSSTSEAWERVSPGWTATEWGYFYPDLEAARIQRALTGNRQVGAHWYETYTEGRDDALTQADLQQGQLRGLVGYLSTERTASDVATAAVMATGEQRDFGFGFFAGAGVVPGGFEPVIGAGFVWLVR